MGKWDERRQQPPTALQTVTASYIRDGYTKAEAEREAQKWQARMEQMRAEREAAKSRDGAPMNIFEDLKLRKAAEDYQPPAADLGYCVCGTVWNIEAMAAEKFVEGTCPDCGEVAVEIEKSR